MFYEIRTERARAGHGAELARYMDETVVPLHQEMGMHVVGVFTVADDEDAFVWIRRFEDAADQERVLAAVHGDPRCTTVVDTLSALSGGPASMVRLEPAPRSALR
ncbi:MULTISPECIES: NIPSNAP family protein [Streptomyces]|uniref:NIPSNAP family protein n=1 Tax=Streptomyces TaxID=1883 RepID=UPI0006E31710|nr:MULTISPECIES: NIPSNAP family protein [Streptomyces phaeochromogenes group]MCX4564200.1 NIPSNAP family protein [Streptomyces phaeochromogenes]GHB91083.1 NIPSNAP family protein [Streptomyces umbrinus]